MKAQRFAVAGLLLLGLLLQLAAMSGRTLNSDEVYLPLQAREGRLLATLTTDVHPPLYPLIVGAMVRAGLPEKVWRLFSILCWLGTAWVAYRIGRRFGGERVGLTAMGLLLTSTQGALLGSMVRSYSLAAFLAAAAVLLFLRLLEAPSKIRLIAFATAAALGAYTFYYNLILLAVFALVGFYLWWRTDEGGGAALAGSVLAGLSFVPWLPFLWRQAAAANGGWAHWQAAPWRILRRFTQVLAEAGGIDGLESGIRALWPSIAGTAATAITLVLLVWGAIAVYRAAPTERRASARALPLLAGGTVALVLVAHFIFGLFVALHYFVILAAVAAPLLAAPFARRGSLVGGALVGIALVANLVAWPAVTAQGREPFAAAAEFIDSRLAQNDPVLGIAWFAVDGYRWYGQGHESIGVPLDLRSDTARFRVQPGITEPTDIAQLRLRLLKTDRLALLLTHTTWQGADRGEIPVKRLLASEGFYLANRNQWPTFGGEPTVRAEIWERTGRGALFLPLP